MADSSRPHQEAEIRMIQTSRPSSIGRVRTCRSVSPIEWITISISLLSILIGVGASVFRFSTLPYDDPDIIFSILILMNLCFASFYLFHGIFQEQPFEMVTLTLTLFLVWLLIVVNYFSGVVLEMKLIRAVVCSILTVPNMVLAGLVGWNYFQSGNLIFKTVGADIKFQRLCRQLFFAYSLLVFDVQAQLSCLVLALQRGFLEVTPNRIVLIVFGTIYALAWACVGYSAIRTENLRMTWLFGISSVLQPVCIIYLFTEAMDVTGFDKVYSVLGVAIYISATSLLLVHFALLAMTVQVAHNFGKGLRIRVYGEPILGTGPTERSESDSLLRRNIQAENYDAITPAP